MKICAGFANRVEGLEERAAHLRQEMVDERLTSWEAERLLEEVQGRVMKDPATHGKPSKKDLGRVSVDAVAAAVILKEYLGRRQAASIEP